MRRSLRQANSSAEPTHNNKSTAWTREQYDLMQEHAHELGYHLITPYRKNLVNIKVGEIVEAAGLTKEEK